MDGDWYLMQDGQVVHETTLAQVNGTGTWYYVETSFFEQVNNFITAKIPISDVTLPDCPFDKNEGAYNEMVANSNADFCLMDRKLLSVENGPKQIEACDIFTRDKKMIHVKNKGQSAQLSHLFSQGKVSFSYAGFRYRRRKIWYRSF